MTDPSERPPAPRPGPSPSQFAAALATLTAGERRLFEWSRRQGLSLHEIALRLGRPRAWVASELVRVLRTLRDRLAAAT